MLLQKSYGVLVVLVLVCSVVVFASTDEDREPQKTTDDDISLPVQDNIETYNYRLDRARPERAASVDDLKKARIMLRLIDATLSGVIENSVPGSDVTRLQEGPTALETRFALKRAAARKCFFHAINCW